VFTLLETLYHSFDEIAKRRRVFKVETIGDCYVAVSGLPEPRKDHATVMARFARDCIGAMNDLTKKLEITLGPDTGDLALRVGLHSGPVTAGVLRGDKSRFQLYVLIQSVVSFFARNRFPSTHFIVRHYVYRFGDTVNTAARMESHGVRNRIHASSETAGLLKAAGKSQWLVPRRDAIEAKGKGKLETFFIDIARQSTGSQKSGKSATSSSEGSVQLNMPHVQESLCNRAGTGVIPDGKISPQLQRRIQWNSDILLRMLQQIVARRNAEQAHQRALGMSRRISLNESFKSDDGSSSASNASTGHYFMEEIEEVITLPNYNPEVAKHEENPHNIVLDPIVVKQLQEYVTIVASLYHHDNPFHNFEHASHVCMSVVKLLARIVAPEDVLKQVENEDAADQLLYDHTYGITSDPITQFAVAFSALIHDGKRELYTFARS